MGNQPLERLELAGPQVAFSLGSLELFLGLLWVPSHKAHAPLGQAPKPRSPGASCAVCEPTRRPASCKSPLKAAAWGGRGNQRPVASRRGSNLRASWFFWLHGSSVLHGFSGYMVTCLLSVLHGFACYILYSTRHHPLPFQVEHRYYTPFRSDRWNLAPQNTRPLKKLGAW